MGEGIRRPVEAADDDYAVFQEHFTDLAITPDEGQIHEIGPPEQVIGNPQEAETMDFLKSVR